MNGIIDIIKQFIEWFNSTPLPKDTAKVFVDILKLSGTKLIDLAQEYINIIFGA